MKRLAYCTVLAWLMAANAMLLAYQAPSGHPLSRVLGAVGLGYASIMVAAYAAGAAWHVGRANACRFVHRRPRSYKMPKIQDLAVAEKKQHAAAMAAVAAEPMQPQSLDDTADMPIVQTGLTWGFGPHSGVVEPLPEPWTAPGRHGREATLPMPVEQLREYDYEPAGGVR